MVGQGAACSVFQNIKDVPLISERSLGSGTFGAVDSVICRRIRLARKTITISRSRRREHFVTEIKSMQNLKHAHIIQLVGTYILGSQLSILMYPVADWTLEQFMEYESPDYVDPKEHRRAILLKFMCCLASAVEYIHRSCTKHMDLKTVQYLGPPSRKRRKSIHY